MSKKAVVIEDHPLFGNSLKSIFIGLGYSPVFLHTSAEGALECIHREQPDLVATDIELTDMSGFDLLQKCEQLFPVTRFIVISMHDQPSYPKRAFKLGASGYVVKSDDEKDICDCVRQVESGRVFISKTIRNKHPDLLFDSEFDESDDVGPDLSLLTSQEKRILHLLHQGKTSKEIGRALQISYRTVQNHRSNICAKFSLKGPNVLLKFAIDHADDLFADLP